VGKGLGADLALEVASAHPELAGVVLDDPLDTPMDAIFNDSRARLVPAHMLVHDRWDTAVSSANLKVPSLWFYQAPASGQPRLLATKAYDKVETRKMRVWLDSSPDAEKNYVLALSRWLDDQQARRQNR